MLNKNLLLSERIFTSEVDLVPTRQGFGEGLVETGKRNEQVIALCADLTESTKMDLFRKEFPERFIEVGVAEQALVTVAAGMAAVGKIPFIASYATFSPGRNWEQIRTTVALNEMPVKIVGSHSGVSVGPDGATHQALEDIALMRVLPNVIVVVPCDAIEAKKATIAIADNGKPSYIRLAREKTAVMTTEETPFEIGKAEIYWQSASPQAAIVACGPLLSEALKAAHLLEEQGIEVLVVNSHTVKPLDEETILSVARRTGAVVSVEEHQVSGGLGSTVAELLVKREPTPMEFVGMQDSFGESGKPEELWEKYGLTAERIEEKVRKVITRKNTSE